MKDTKFNVESIERHDGNNSYIITRQTKQGTQYLTNQLKLVILKDLYLDNKNVFFADRATCISVLYCYNNNKSLDIPTTNHCWDWSDEQAKYDNLCPWLENDGGEFYCNLGFTHGKLIEEGNTIVKADRCKGVNCGPLD